MLPLDARLDDEALLDLLFERALTAGAAAVSVELENLLESRGHLRMRANEVLALAGELASIAAPPVTPPKPGIQALVGGFRVVAEAGRGGMGIVYRARQEALGREVALKVLAPALSASARARARFEWEARMLARVRHPAVVAVHEVLTTPDLCAYAMEWVEGRSLAQVLHGRQELDVAQVLDLGIVIGGALSVVHAAGLVHRDIKPSNILLRPDGSPVLIDFGLARDAEHDLHTASGEFLGTMAYAAPEQILGRHQEVGARTDVYGLAATLHAALAGGPPFAADGKVGTPRQVETERRGALRPLHPRIPRELDIVLDKAMDPDPSRRYVSVAAFADDLRRIRDLEPIQARPMARWRRSWLWLRRNPTAVAVVTMLAAALSLTLWQASAVDLARRGTERHFERAQRAVWQLTLLARDELLDIAGAAEQRQNLLRSALSFYRDVASDVGPDPRIRLPWAVARAQAGRLHKELGDLAAARTELTRALSQLGPAVAGPDPDQVLLAAHAEAQRDLAATELDAGDLAAAETAAKLAMASYERLVDGLTRSWEQVSELLSIRAAIEFHSARWSELELTLAGHAELLTQVSESANAIDLAAARAGIAGKRAAAACRQDRLVDARGHLESALRERRTIAAARPASLSARSELATALLRHAELLVLLAEAPGARTSAVEAMDLFESLKRDSPGSIEVREGLAGAKALVAELDGQPAPASSSRDEVKRLLAAVRAARAKGDERSELAGLQQFFAKFDPQAVESWKDVEIALRELQKLLRKPGDYRELLIAVTSWPAQLQAMGPPPEQVARNFGALWLRRAVSSLLRGDGADAEYAATAGLPLLPTDLRPQAQQLQVEAVIMHDPGRGWRAVQELRDPAGDLDRVLDASHSWRIGTWHRLAGTAHRALGQGEQCRRSLAQALASFETARRDLSTDPGLAAEWVRTSIDLAVMDAATSSVPQDLTAALEALRALSKRAPIGPELRHVRLALSQLAVLPATSLVAGAQALRDELLAANK
ncbi:MAG: serine/threonine protein kinase [Planctomycetes bacterium]|jgi:tetratricopeptide (TPR) repeat protein/predicted Ser/Thr protein kinase|nr:serine/threonine protein kinase [Planctomycetota bacterium]